NLIILVDFLCNAYDFNSLIKKLNKKFIFGDIKIVAISKFKNYTPAKSLKYKYFVECDFSEFGVTKNKCTYCFYDSVPISGNSFSHFTHSSSIFDSYSFWEFIKLTDSSYTLEHYKSKRTRNHFDFRIVCDKIFEKYSYTLAVRLVNLANENNIKPSWINKILFTNDSELKPLINELSSLLKISEENKIEIARESIYTVSADNPGEAIQDLFMRHKDNFKDDKQKIEDWNKSNNVIIVDQAVHNFRTLSALTSVCSHYKFTVLLISLFINRTDSISSANFKKNKFHLLSLYDWPVKSTRFDLCFCRN
ncbi:MAG TPA: hypothetical protein VJY62_11840, partial [Bacteroidia bacterium]|nr:hypothetical protein [Bacteroidia bacterium]